MELYKGTNLTINGEKYTVMGIVNMNNMRYAFVKNESEEKFYALEINGKEVKVVYDRKVREKLFPIFQKLLLDNLSIDEVEKPKKCI